MAAWSRLSSRYSPSCSEADLDTRFGVVAVGARSAARRTVTAYPVRSSATTSSLQRPRSGGRGQPGRIPRRRRHGAGSRPALPGLPRWYRRAGLENAPGVAAAAPAAWSSQSRRTATPNAANRSRICTHRLAGCARPRLSGRRQRRASRRSRSGGPRCSRPATRHRQIRRGRRGGQTLSATWRLRNATATRGDEAAGVDIFSAVAGAVLIGSTLNM